MAIQTGVVKLLNKTFAEKSAQETVDYLFNIQKIAKKTGRKKRSYKTGIGEGGKGYGKDRILTGNIERDMWSLEKYGVLFDDIGTLPLNPKKK